MALSQREKRLLLIPAGLAMVVSFYNWVHMPLFARRAEAMSLRDQVSTDLRKNESRLLKEGNLRVKKEAVVAREKVIDAWVPGKNSAALLIWYLSQVEMQSGARIRGITVADKKQVTPAPAAPAETTPGQPLPADTPSTGAPAPSLTVVQLELKVDARFAQHMLFNQGLEEMPLFLNTNSLAMVKGEQPTLDEVGKLVQSGNATLAAQLLAISPNLNGTYKVDLYFKADKQGPTTDSMYFTDAAGRNDPFANVDEFLETVIRFYSSQPSPDGSRGPLPVLPEDLKGQLG